MDNTEPTIDKIIDDFIYDNIESELDNDTLSRNVWVYGGNGTQIATQWRGVIRTQLLALISDQVAKARIDGIREYADALIDLFVNPPAELGAAEDMHLHPWQIKNMILESLNHLDELNGVKNK